MGGNRKQTIVELLKGIETGDPNSVRVVNEEKYIQHNPQTHEGSEGLAELFKRLAQTSPRVNIVRVFEDGDFVFAHTEYDFAQRNIGFEIFRFEDEQAIEHWDNIQSRQGPNCSGHSMVDGDVDVSDRVKTEDNRSVIQAFSEEILINKHFHKFEDYLDQTRYIEHSPTLDDNPHTLITSLTESETSKNATFTYLKCHRILADGNFVLSVSEGLMDGVLSAFFDLYRLHDNKIVEHWDTREAIPARSEWKNDNGKF